MTNRPAHPERRRARFATGITTLLLSLAMVGCESTPPSAAQVANDQTPDATSIDTNHSGIDINNLDDTVHPGDDFFAYVNGRWLADTEIPPDRSRWGTFSILREQATSQLFDLITSMTEDPAETSAQSPATGAEKARVLALYRSFMDLERLENLGVEPARALLTQVDQISTSEELATFFGRLQYSPVSVPLGAYVSQDGRDATRYLTHFAQWGLGLPDRSYYLQDTERLRSARDAYRAYARTLFRLSNQTANEAAESDSEAEFANALLRVETSIAQAHWERAAVRDRERTYNLFTAESANDTMPRFPWAAYLEGAGGVPDEFIVAQPDYADTLGSLLTSVPLADWKVYLKFQILDALAPYLSDAFVQAHFELHGKALRGTQELRDRWKRAVTLLNRTVGEDLGKLYVEKHFNENAKRRMDDLVNNLMAAFDDGIGKLEWMTPQTQAQARDKLNKLRTKIGYPDVWRDYSGLDLRADDLVGNVIRANAFEYQRQLNKLGGPIDREEWGMAPQTVNAYYHSKLNEIVFPAAILQPPFFDPDADPALNYGAIGAVIGHEISHAFDDQGRKSDGDGNLRDWWTELDEKEFSARADRLTAQYVRYEPIPGRFINGKLTLGENIGDLSGVAVAYAAYQKSLGKASAPVLDGLTGPQRFFIGYARVWRDKQRPASMEQQLLTDPHSPARYRAVGVLRNITPFYDAFDVSPQRKMYLPFDERVTIW